MHIEVVQALRCPSEHPPSWLVARTDTLEARHIVSGVLGCPVCGAEYPIARGVLQLGAPIGAAPDDDLGDDAAVRAAALLGLTTPDGVVVLAGAWARQAVEVAALTEGIHVIALDAPYEAPPAGLGVSRIDAGATMPFGTGVVRGAALDTPHATAEALEQATNALSSGGRLLAPATTAVPSYLTPLARDDRWWVAERPAAAPVVSLGTARRK
jgi:uncharacterized protein YbaR (Trm112 family)